MRGIPEGGKRRLRRALTWDERLLVAEWCLDRYGIRSFDARNVDIKTRNRVIVRLLGMGMSREDVAASFRLTVGGVTRIVNRLKKGTGVTAEIQAAKSRCRNSVCQLVPEIPGTRR